MSITKITPDNRSKFLQDNNSKFIVVIFDGEFSGQQDIVKNVSDSLIEFAKKNDNVTIAFADVEENNDFALEQSVLSVPVILFMGPEGKNKKKIDTLECEKLIKLLEQEIIKYNKLQPVGDSKQSEQDASNKESNFKDYLKYLTTKSPVMVFMKGEPTAPRCGFSKQLVAILAKHDIKYDSFDILEDEQVRQGLKEYSDWPTYPQIYANGEFVGGLDILKQMEESGDLKSTLTPAKE